MIEPMDELKAQIKLESNRASHLSQEAVSAFSGKQFEQGKLLMKEAVIASKECQKLIQQYTQIDNLQTPEKARITTN
jgi:hypothetical protein